MPFELILVYLQLFLFVSQRRVANFFATLGFLQRGTCAAATTNIQTYINTYIYIYASIHTYIHACMHAYMHAYNTACPYTTYSYLLFHTQLAPHQSFTISFLFPAFPMPSLPFFCCLLEEVDMWGYPVR